MAERRRANGTAVRGERTERGDPAAHGARTYTIGAAATASGVSAKMIRYYEQEGLIPRAARTASNYRTYSQADVHTLQFVRRARKLGFSMPQLRMLLALWQDRGRPSASVKKLALAHVAELDARIAELAGMRDTLRDLAQACAGDERPDCPILRDLGRAVPAARAPRRGGGTTRD